MATEAVILQHSRLRAMVTPREHGAWGMMLVPLVTGVAVASAVRVNWAAVALFLVAAPALFWLRTPVEAWLGTSAIKAHSGQERTAVIRVSLGLAVVAAVAVAALFRNGYFRGLLVIGLVAALAFAAQAIVKGLGRRGRMPAQVIGAVGLTSTAAGAYYVATGRLDHVAAALWIANWLFAGNQVHFVQARIHSSSAATIAEKVHQNRGFLAGQVFLLAVIPVLTRMTVFPKFAVFAFVPALLRGTIWFLRGRRPLDVHKLGFSELAQALIFGVLLCAAFLN